MKTHIHAVLEHKGRTIHIAEQDAVGEVRQTDILEGGQVPDDDFLEEVVNDIEAHEEIHGKNADTLGWIKHKIIERLTW